MTACPGWCIREGEHVSHNSEVGEAEHTNVLICQVPPYRPVELYLLHQDLVDGQHISLDDAKRTAALLAHLGHHKLAALITRLADLAAAAGESPAAAGLARHSECMKCGATEGLIQMRNPATNVLATFCEDLAGCDERVTMAVTS